MKEVALKMATKPLTATWMKSVTLFSSIKWKRNTRSSTAMIPSALESRLTHHSFLGRSSQIMILEKPIICKIWQENLTSTSRGNWGWCELIYLRCCLWARIRNSSRRKRTSKQSKQMSYTFSGASIMIECRAPMFSSISKDGTGF